MIAIGAHGSFSIARDACIVAALATPLLEDAAQWLRARLSARHEPPIVALGKLLAWIPFEPIKISRVCFLALERPRAIPAGLLRGPGTVRAGTPADADRLTRPEMRATFLKRFADGDRCAVAVVDGRVVGYEWFSAHPILWKSRPTYNLGIPDGFLYAYDADIDPAYRNCGFWPRFKAHLSDLMREEGRTGVITYVTLGNWPSLRTHLRFGFQPTKTLLAIRIVGLTLLLHESEKSLEAFKKAFVYRYAQASVPSRLGLTA